uniref:Uncharacterized protein n=1 Tax=Spironucleus salmonicida TaxID=348837 RepID=V6LQG1_9EUKA|eukprot:EST46820.1 Hypothetical protein SS50377_13150 [Spironucleus salmonicida]
MNYELNTDWSRPYTNHTQRYYNPTVISFEQQTSRTRPVFFLSDHSLGLDNQYKSQASHQVNLPTFSTHQKYKPRKRTTFRIVQQQQ